MTNEIKIIVIQPLGIIGLLLIGLGFYVEFIGSERILKIPFLSVLSSYPKISIFVGLVLVIFYLYLQFSALKKRVQLANDFLSK